MALTHDKAKRLPSDVQILGPARLFGKAFFDLGRAVASANYLPGKILDRAPIGRVSKDQRGEDLPSSRSPANPPFVGYTEQC